MEIRKKGREELKTKLVIWPLSQSFILSIISPLSSFMSSNITTVQGLTLGLTLQKHLGNDFPVYSFQLCTCNTEYKIHIPKYFLNLSTKPQQSPDRRQGWYKWTWPGWVDGNNKVWLMIRKRQGNNLIGTRYCLRTLVRHSYHKLGYELREGGEIHLTAVHCGVRYGFGLIWFGLMWL